LVSTISFSGVARMDYSLPGNNVLKDHSQPASHTLREGLLRSVVCGILLVNKHHTDTNCKNGENYSGYEVQRPPPSAF